MILLIDNYDSFTYNLFHFLGELGAKVRVERNDAISADEALALKPEGIVLSPGPCTPNEAGICLDVIRKLPSGQYRLYSRKVDPRTGRRRNLGTFKSRAAAEKHERAVQYFKRH